MRTSNLVRFPQRSTKLLLLFCEASRIVSRNEEVGENRPDTRSQKIAQHSGKLSLSLILSSNYHVNRQRRHRRTHAPAEKAVHRVMEMLDMPNLADRSTRVMRKTFHGGQRCLYNARRDASRARCLFVSPDLTFGSFHCRLCVEVGRGGCVVGWTLFEDRTKAPSGLQ